VNIDGLDAPVSLKPENLARIDAREHGAVNSHAGRAESEQRDQEDLLEKEADSPFMDVLHLEPASRMEADETAAVAQELWSGWVEQLLTKRCAFVSSSTSVDLDDSDRHIPDDATSSYGHSSTALGEANRSLSRSIEFGEKIFVLRWSRHPRELAEALRQNPLLEPIRAAAFDAGQSCDHATGATILLYPDQYDAVLKLISGLDLRPYHTVVNEAFRPLVEDAATQLRSKANIRLRSQRHLAILPNTEDSDEILVVENSCFNLVRVAHSNASIAHTDPIGERMRSPRAVPLTWHQPTTLQ